MLPRPRRGRTSKSLSGIKTKSETEEEVRETTQETPAKAQMMHATPSNSIYLKI